MTRGQHEALRRMVAGNGTAVVADHVRGRPPASGRSTTIGPDTAAALEQRGMVMLSWRRQVGGRTVRVATITDAGRERAATADPHR